MRISKTSSRPAVRPAREALHLTGTFLQAAVRGGARKGLAKAAASANPAMLMLEAASAVVRAVGSFVELSKARAHRDGLSSQIPLQEQRLELEREQLQEQIAVARAGLERYADVREAVGKMTLSCVELVRHCMDALVLIRQADLPDLRAFDQAMENLMEADQVFRRNLARFNNMMST